MRALFTRSSLQAGSILWVLPALLLGEVRLPSEWIEELGSEDYVERVEAQQRIATWSSANPGERQPCLLAEYEKAEIPEIRLRLRDALRDAVVAAHFEKHGQGYAGLQMQNLNVIRPDNGEPTGCVRVERVHPASPALKAGLVPGEVIFSLEGEFWPPGGGAMEAFSTVLRSKKPGEAMVLSVLRGEILVPVTLVLGVRPLCLDDPDRMLRYLMAGADPELLMKEEERRERIFSANGSRRGKPPQVNEHHSDTFLKNRQFTGSCDAFALVQPRFSFVP